jgi:hypothetical protein
VLGQLVVRICTEPLPISAASSTLPVGFDVWLQRAMAKHPADRFQSAAELGESLALLLASTAEPAAGVDSAETLDDEHAALQRARVASVGSTLEHGSLAPPTGQPGTRKPRSLPLPVVAVACLAVLGLAAVLRIGEPSPRVTAVEVAQQVEPMSSAAVPVTPSAAAASDVPAPAPLGSSPRPTSSGQERAIRVDAGVASDARKPVLVRPKQRPPIQSAPPQSAQPNGTPARAFPQEELRRKR